MNKSIKLIKQGGRTLPGETKQASAVTAKTDNQVRREIVETVTTWIKERRAIESEQRQASLYKPSVTGASPCLPAAAESNA
jgi:hypothetical protein